MVHILAPKPTMSSLPIFYNVDVAVGRGAPNSSHSDILLVQYFLWLIGKNVDPNSKLSSLAKVPVTGSINPETISAIEVLQVADGAAPDGHVSVAHGYRFGGSFYTIMIMNFNIKSKFFNQWPNIEEMPECPGLLNMACRRALVGDRP